MLRRQPGHHAIDIRAGHQRDGCDHAFITGGRHDTIQNTGQSGELFRLDTGMPQQRRIETPYRINHQSRQPHGTLCFEPCGQSCRAKMPGYEELA